MGYWYYYCTASSKNDNMKKSALLLGLLCLLSVSNVFAQKNKSDKKQRKEFLDMAIPVCVVQMDSDTSINGFAQTVNTKGYCTCMLENLFDKYSLTELGQMFVNKDESEMMMSFFDDKANYSSTLECMRNNIKDEVAMKAFILNGAFGVENCKKSLKESGLYEELNADGYCSCVQQRLAQEFTFEEILAEAYNENGKVSDKLGIMAMECMLANTKE